MIVQMLDATTGVSLYINPAFVVSLRPDPGEPDAVTVVKMSDGETIRVRGEHRAVADKLMRVVAA
jgi:hypothetical protein